MKIKTRRIDKSLPLPTYEKKSACFDFICREGAVLAPREVKLVPSNAVIQVPEGYTILIFSRSSTPIRKGLTLANGVGVLDSVFSGHDDEIMIQFLNITDHEVEIEKGEILAQGMLIKHEAVEWEETDKFEEKGRGGYQGVLHRPDKKTRA
jgi:dUTP pyrophosphatase